MSFKTNDVEQLSLFDSFLNLTAREQKALENSWAKVFAEEVFPKIDEKPFAVLYSDKASRPNTPVNVIIGACIIKELFDYSDDELVEGLMLDLRLQYALHTTSFTEQPLSDKTLSRFRRRCYDYEQTHGVDLYKAAIQNYNKEIAKMMELDGKIRRMDSLMINSNMLLNPTDPEATYRRKAGKEYRGYVTNVEETVGKNGSVVTSYEYESNIHSDSQFIKEHLEALPKQEENTSMIVDGAYYSEEAETMAAEKNIELLPTALTAKKNRRDVSGFEMDEEKTKAIKCPAGNTPRSCCYKKSNDEFKITFDRDVCANCPHKEQCHAKIFKNIARVLITKKSLIRLALEERMSSETYNLYRRIRNGVETIPSILRKNYHLEKLPRGKQRGRFFFGSKIAALNFRKLFHYVKGSSNYAENPLLA